MRPILVTGGTGTLGRHVVTRLTETGCDVRVLSRKSHDNGAGIEFVTGDLVSGEGIVAAVDGAEVIVHCAGTTKGDDQKTRVLVHAAERIGVAHLVYISVVGAERVRLVSGIDRALFGYFGSKLAAEQVVANSGLPWTTLRATQFYDAFVTIGRQMAKMPAIPVPAGFRFQPVDTGEVAARLVQLALGAPAGQVADLAGPQAYPMAALLRSYLRTRGKHRAIVPIRFPGQAARAVREGANLPLDPPVGIRTWEDFLAERTSAPRTAHSGKH